MKNDIVLVRPALELKEKALDYRREHFQHGEEIIYGSELFDKKEDYEECLSSVTLNTNPKTVNENWVVTDTFFAIRKSDDRIIGKLASSSNPFSSFKRRISFSCFLTCLRRRAGSSARLTARILFSH